MPSVLRDAIVSLSLANLWFLSAWYVVLTPSHFYYRMKTDRGFIDVLSLGLDILLLALIFWLAARAVRRSQSPRLKTIALWLLLAGLIVPVNSAAVIYTGSSLLRLWLFSSSKWIAISAFLVTLGILLTLRRTGVKASRLAMPLLLVLSPILAMNLVSAIWQRRHFIHNPIEFHEKVSPTTAARRLPAPKILWVVFDELDQQLAFVNRPSGIELPEFDRLRTQSLFATNAYPPGEFTDTTMPALITGQLVSDSKPLRADELILVLSSKEEVRWSTQPNVFSLARAEGFTTGAAGWYHPYCRVLGSGLDWCAWEPTPLGLKTAMLHWARTVFQHIPFALRLFRVEYKEQAKQDHIDEYLRISHAARLAQQKDVNLTFLHFPVPHLPWIYNAETESLSSANGHSYESNLLLADRTLGDLRRTLEESGRWDTATVLVTSDHWWREGPMVNGRRNHRIPFILKLPGQTAGAEYTTPFNTIVTRDLLLELLRGKLQSADEVSAFLDSHSPFAESPYTVDLP